jgi:hypothetical protein
MTQHPRFRSFPLVGLIVSLLLVSVFPGAATAGLTYTVTLDVPQVTVTTTDRGAVVRVAGGDYQMLSDEGLPELPFRIVNFVLPQGEVVESVRFQGAEEIVLQEGITVKSAPPRIADDGAGGAAIPLAPASGDQYPAVYGKYLGTGYLHGYAIASVALFPLRTGGGRLALTKDISVEVITTPGDPEMEVVTRKRYVERIDQDVARQLKAMVVNPADAGGYDFGELRVTKKVGGFQPTSFPSLEGSPVDYVIITNDSLAAAFQTLADWKTAKGVPTVIRTTEWIAANYRNGSDLQETIRYFIKDAYARWGITYVLIGGDSEQVPPRFGSSFYLGLREIPADMYYACLDGDWNADHDQYFGEGGSTDNTDLYAEVYLGRLPVTSVASINLLTSKIIDYESTVDSDFARKVILMAEVLFPTDWTEGDPISMNGATFSEDVFTQSIGNPDLNVTRMYETDDLYPGSVPEGKSAALDSIDSGYNHVNHVGHGFRFNMSVADGSIVNEDADLMTNQTRYGNFYLLNCTAAAFTYFCLAEHLLLCPTGGAVTAIGANESAFPIMSSLLMEEYYSLLFTQDVYHIGETFARSRLKRTAIAAISDNADLYTHYIYTLLGDPEMPMWTNAIQSLTVSHVSDVGLGSTSIQVTVEDSWGSVSSALVCLSKGTDDYQYGTTDGSGQVTFEFRAESEGEIHVVATAQNCARYDGTITVTGESGAYVSLGDMLVDDDNNGGTSGNGDGVIDGGETFDLWLEVVNTGASASGNLDLILSSTDVNVTILDDTAAVGVVAGGGARYTSDPVRVTFSNAIGDESAVAFDLVVRDGGVERWADEFSKVVHAPELDLLTLRIDDSATGNGDGVVDANEDFQLYYGLKNYGTGTAQGLTAQVVDLDGGFVITSGTDGYTDLGPMEEGENTNGFSLREPDVSVEHHLEITIADAFGRAYVDTIELRPPDPPANLTFNPSFGSDRLSVEWEQSTSTDAARYNVYHSGVSGGPYTRANTDPVDHGVYLDVGLAASTRYYYVVRTIDESGNEGAPSAEFNGSTNPDQMEGWPIHMSNETVSSPVLGDIDGDGDIEIVQGNMKVCAWHHNGVELLDGDAVALTWGILTTAGNSYVSPIALAQIDGLAGRDIIAGSRDTKEVYVFDYLGNTLAGWPQPLENPIRAALSVGDIDGDGELEIVAVDEYGVIYAWEKSGAEHYDGDSNPTTPGVLFRLPGCSFMYSSPALADMDGDGDDDIVIGSQSDELYVINGQGVVLPGWPVPLPNDISGCPAVGDIDGDGGGDLEVVVNTWSGDVRAFHHDGSLMYQKWFPNQVYFGPSPALGDLNGDGKLEMLLPSANRKLYCIQYDGSNLPGWPIDYTDQLYTESSPVIADMDGDGNPDVILGNETKLLNAWDSSGMLLDGFPLSTDDAMRAVPTVDDVDGDGDVELITAGWDRNVYVWDFPTPFDRKASHWPGFQGNMFHNGWFGSKVPTAVGAVAFAFDIGGGGAVNLTWSVPAPASYGRFDVARAVASEEGTPGEFAVLATGRVAGVDGTVRYADGGARVGERYVYQLRAAEEAGSEVVHTTGTIYVPVGAGSLSQNYPNPFNPTTRITYYLPEGSARRVRLVVYDVRGARVRTLVDGELRGGRYTVEWDGRNDGGEAVGSGVYFYRLTERSFTKTKKMLLLK